MNIQRRTHPRGFGAVLFIWPVGKLGFVETRQIAVCVILRSEATKNLTAQMSDYPHGGCRSGCFKILRCAQDDSKTRVFQR